MLDDARNRPVMGLPYSSSESRGEVFSYIVAQFGMVTRTSPFSVLDPFTAPDGEAFDTIRARPFGFIARSVRTGELVAFASDGIEAVEVERMPRGAGR